MIHALDVGRPLQRFGVLRAGNDEAALGQLAGDGAEQALDSGLTIVAVGPEVPEIPVALADDRAIDLAVDRAVEGTRPLSPELALDVEQDWAARKRKVEIEPGDEARFEIFVVTGFELAERDRGIDIVEGLDPARVGLHVASDLHAVGNV